MKYQLRSTAPFDKWLAKIKGQKTRARIIRRIDRLVPGIFGDCKNIQADLLELRIFFGANAGYRGNFTIKEKE